MYFPAMFFGRLNGAFGQIYGHEMAEFDGNTDFDFIFVFVFG